MTTTTVRISRAAHAQLVALSEQTGQPLTSTLEDAIEALLAQRFALQTAMEYEALRADADAWASYLKEVDLPAGHDLAE